MSDKIPIPQGVKKEDLEKYIPKRLLVRMDNALKENEMSIPYLEKIKPYKFYDIPADPAHGTKATKGALYTIADMMTMFRYGLHHNDEVTEQNERKPKFVNGSVLVHKDDDRDTITIKGYVGEHYKVKIQGEKKYQYYVFDYVEDNYKPIPKQ